MTIDGQFRLIVLALVGVVLPFAFHHRLRSYTGERLDRWQEGAVILFGLRLSAVPGFVGGLAWMINPQWMSWSSVPLPAAARWLGVMLIGCWAGLILWTFRHLGTNLTDTVVTRENHTLVTTGPYRYVRHPFYLAFFLSAAGGSLVSANWFLCLAGLIPAAFLVVRTETEEAKLIERFGDDYRNYMRSTGRFLPRRKSHE